MFKGLPRLYESNLLSVLLYDSEPLKHFNYDLKKRAFYTWIEDTFSMIVLWKLPKFTKRCKLPNKIFPCNEPVSLGIKLFINIIKLSMAAGYLVCQIPSKLRNYYFLIALWEEIEKKVGVEAGFVLEVDFELVENLLGLAEFVEEVNELFLLSLVHRFMFVTLFV